MNKIAIKASHNKLIFIAISELMANSYLNTNKIVGFDNTLMNKIRNLKPGLEAELKRDVKYIEEKGGFQVLETYYQLTDAFERILLAAQKGDNIYLERLIQLLTAFNNDDIRIYESKEQYEEIEKAGVI